MMAKRVHGLMVGFMVVTLISSPSWAATKKKKKEKESPTQAVEQTMTVPVPKSEINVEAIRFKPPRPSELEFRVSSFVPESFERGSYTGRRSAFVKGDFPNVGVTQYNEVVSWDNGLRVSSMIGLSYLQLVRTNSIEVHGLSSGSDTQTISLFMGRLGASTEWNRVIPWGFSPNVGLSLLPSWATAGTSSFEKGVSVFGLPASASAGLLWRSGSSLSAIRGNMSIGVSGEVVRGSVGGSSVDGVGVNGEFRISL